MRKIAISSLILISMVTGLYSESHEMANQISEDKILIDSGVGSWVPNPLIGDHVWKKFFSDEKYSPSKRIESTWYFDSKTIIKTTTEKLNFRGQPMELEGATLVWTKVVGSKPDGIKYLLYALWPERRVALFFGIFEKDDGTKYVEDVSEMEDIQKLPPGLLREVLENLFNAIFKPWWKIW